MEQFERIRRSGFLSTEKKQNQFEDFMEIIEKGKKIVRNYLNQLIWPISSLRMSLI